MSRYLTGRAVTLTHKFLDDETVLTPTTVTVTVTRVGSATPAATGPATQATGVYTFSAGMLAEAVYTVRWDGVTAIDTEYVEVVGGFMFNIPEARESDPDLTDATRFPAADIRHYREVVEAEFERITGRSFTPRTARLRIDHDGSDWLLLPMRDVRGISALLDSAGTPVTATLVIDELGAIEGMSALPRGTYALDVSYGFTMVPDDVKRAGMLRTRYFLMAEKSGIPDRATTYQPAEGGTYALATPGQRGARTGIPDVDVVLTDYTFRILEDVSL